MSLHRCAAGWCKFITLNGAFLAMLGTSWSAEALRIDQISQKSFENTIRHLEWNCGGYGLTVVTQLNYQNILAKIDVRTKQSRMLEVMRRAWLETIFERDPAAALGVPLRIYVYERDDGRTVVSYHRPSAIFATYGQPGLQEFGEGLDKVLWEIVHMATK
jgi:uncharacterized protein (DUF302 family)